MSQNKEKTGVLLLNLGTPDSPSVTDVGSYLSQFLNDPRVIDIPWILRKILVNLVIVPFRSFSSARIYKKLWTTEGSPLLIYSEKVKTLLNEVLGAGHEVHLAMRYKNPSIPSVLKEMRKKNYQKIILLPMFPQYASASTGSALELAMREISRWWIIPEVKVVSQYYDHPTFIKAILAQNEQFDLNTYDHILFSYHGLPVRQVDKVYDQGICEDHDCEHEITGDNKYCYKATCYATTRALVKALKIPEEKYTVCFQSRLDKNWLEPFSDKVVEEQAKLGAKRLLVFSPAFTADCLETIIEIGDEYQEIFEELGGEKVQLVPSLNDHPLWIQCLKEIVLEQ